MGVSTDAILFFGYCFDDDFEHPMLGPRDGGGDEDDWWMEVRGYAPLHVPFTKEGDYAPGFSKDDPRIDEEFDHRRDWRKANPLPVELVRHCSGEYPMYGLAVKKTAIQAHRGYPSRVELPEVPEEDIAKLDSFVEEFGIDVTDRQKAWWLVSYYSY